MSLSVAPTAQPPLTSPQQPWWLWGALLLSCALLLYVFREGLSLMVAWWEREEYSHGYMIPLITAFLLWQRINEFPATMRQGSWWGVVLLFGGLAVFALGELSALYTLIQYGFLLCLAAIALAFFGTAGTRIISVPLAYLIFMIPLPNFLYFNLSSQLQLMSSAIGVAVIRLFDISVFLEGNVIDLGSMKLQVAEACSGLRYLFPLMSFGFLIAYLYRGPLWQRALLFASTVPITILMNSFRIGVIGVTVDHWGIEMAQGFLHDFEGWVVFMSCVSLLLLEILCFHGMRRDGVKLLDRLDLDVPAINVKLSDFPLDARKQLPLLICAALLVIAAPLLAGLKEREEAVPQRQAFIQFPLQHNHWNGRQVTLEREIVNTLKFSDYFQADYYPANNTANTQVDAPINLYAAWYESQKKGASIHSPRSCIPGDGWRITSLTQHQIASVEHAGSNKPLRVNRAVIQKADVTELVYYWFEGRNRNVTNEYLAKWYIFQDSLMHSRSDGALVRMITHVTDTTQIDAADRRLEQFLQDFYPLLPAYIP